MLIACICIYRARTVKNVGNFDGNSISTENVDIQKSSSHRRKSGGYGIPQLERCIFPLLLPIAPEEVSVNISESSQKLIGHRLSAMILNKVDVIVGM